MALLSQEEQHALIEEHIPFAEKGAIAHWARYGKHADLDELKSAAYLGLVRAAKKFDPSKGVTFKTYAFNWCESQMGMVHRQHKRANGWSYAPNSEEIAAGVKPHQMVCRAERFDMPEIQTKDGEIQMGMDMLQSGDANPETLLLYKEHMRMESEAAEVSREATIKGYFERAKTERQRDVVQGWADGLSMLETAERLGISRARVQQLASDVALPSFAFKPRRDGAIVTPSVVVGVVPPDARGELERRLRSLEVGQIVSYGELAEVVGGDVHRARGLLTTIRQRLLDDRLVFGPVFGVGLKRLDDAAVLNVGARSIRTAGNAARRGLRVLAAVRDFEALPNDEKIRHHVALAQLGMLAHVSSDEAAIRVQAKISASPVFVPTHELVEAMKDSL